MYDSIKPWINIPFIIKPFIRRNGTGSKIFDTPVSSTCYPQGDNILVSNVDGAEITSSTQLYVPGDTLIKVTDNVIFEEEERPIKHIATFYRNGVADIKVVYL